MTITQHYRALFEERFGWKCELDDSEILELHYLEEEAGSFEEEQILMQMKILQEATMP